MRQETVRVCPHREGNICYRPTWSTKQEAQEMPDYLERGDGRRLCSGVQQELILISSNSRLPSVRLFLMPVTSWRLCPRLISDFRMRFRSACIQR